MLASLQRVLALAGTPVAAILALGIVAEVVNLWRVEETYRFSYVEAWHGVGLIDRWVLIGLGVKYLIWGLLAATVLGLIIAPSLLAVILLLGPLRIKRLQDWPRTLRRQLWPTSPVEPSVTQSNHTVGWIQTSTSPDKSSQGTGTVWWTQAATSPNDDTSSTPAGLGPRIVRAWVWLIVLATVLMLIWLPIRAYFHPGTDEVLKYLPHVEMTLTVDLANAADVTPQSSGQTLTGVSEAAEENGDSSYTVAGWLETSGDKTQSEPVGRSQELKGILLSHDSAYWYVLSQEDPYKCMIVAIPVDKASEIRFPSPQISAPPGNRSVGCQT